MTATLRLAKTGPSDADLVAEIASGDLESLGILFDRHGADVRRFLGRLGAPPSDLDDLVQLTFVEIIGAARGFDPRYSVRPWLYGVAAMLSRRHRRTLGRIAARVHAWAQAADPVPPETPDQTFDSRDTERRLWAALEKLSSKKREVFVMVTLEGASGEETATALGIPVNTVWTRLHHARSELRAALFREGDR